MIEVMSMMASYHAVLQVVWFTACSHLGSLRFVLSCLSTCIVQMYTILLCCKYFQEKVTFDIVSDCD